MPEPSLQLAFTVNIAQLVMLGGMIWGLAKMSASVDQLRVVTGELTKGLKEVAEQLGHMDGRVKVLEDRGERRRRDDG